MKPTESSEEGHGRAVEGGVQSGGLAVAPVLEPATPRGHHSHGADASVRSVSGVVAAPAAGGELEDGHTMVDAGPARRFEASHALAGRIRHALDRTLPLGTPAPDPSLFADARQNRALHSRTMLLGGRYLTELGAAPEPPTLRADAEMGQAGMAHATPAALDQAMNQAAIAHAAIAHAAIAHAAAVSQEALTPRAAEWPPTQRVPGGYAAVTPAAPQATAPRVLSEAAQRFVSEGTQHGSVSEPPPEGAVRASFVRPVGLPTAPPPRRRRTIPPGEASAFDSLAPGEPAAAEAPREEDVEHEAFALDRPRGSSFPPGLAAEAPARVSTLGATTSLSHGSPGRGLAEPGRGHSGASGRIGSMPFVRIPDARNPRSSSLSNSVILPPPPQAHDYELASSPSAVPPPLELATTARAALSPPGPALPTTRPAARPRASLLDLPSTGGNPLAGYEAPRQTFWQSSLLVFVVALAVVGLFALGAIAFGFLGKTGW